MSVDRVGCRIVQKKKRQSTSDKQKTAYEISECDWSSDVCSTDLIGRAHVCSSVSSRRRHTRFLNVTGVQTCAVPIDRKSTRLNSSHIQKSRMPSSACKWSSDVR